MSVPSISTASINELRTSFLNDYTIKGDESEYIDLIIKYCTEECFLDVHPQDLEKVKNNDYWLQRFLIHSKSDEKKALEMLWTALTWRKENKINGTNSSKKSSMPNSTNLI